MADDIQKFIDALQANNEVQKQQFKQQQDAFQQSLKDTVKEFQQSIPKSEIDDDLDTLGVGAATMKQMVEDAVKPLTKQMADQQTAYETQITSLQEQLKGNQQQILNTAVPGLPENGGDFDNAPVTKGIPLTWGQYRKNAEKDNDLAALQGYAKQFKNWKESDDSTWEQSPGGTESREPLNPEKKPKEIDEAQFQADQEAVLTRQMTREDFKKKYAEVIIN